MTKKATNSRRASAADAGARKAKRSSRATAAAPSTDKADVQAGGLEATADAIGRTLGRTASVIADHLPWTRATDGLDLLEHDHRRFEALLKQGVETDEKSLTDRKAILTQLARELTVHEQIEEKVLYPALKSHAEAKDIVLEGYQEHHVVDVLVGELQELPPSDERWGAKLKVLKESLDHHIEEEESAMFKTARSVLSPEQLDDVGTRMEAMRAELQDAPPPAREPQARRAVAPDR